MKILKRKQIFMLFLSYVVCFGSSDLGAIDCGRRVTTDADASRCVKEIFEHAEAAEEALKDHEPEHFGHMKACKSGMKGRSFFESTSFAEEVGHVRVDSCTMGEKGNYECFVNGLTGCYVKRVKIKNDAPPKPGQKSKGPKTIDTTLAMKTTKAKVVIVPDNGELRTAYPYSFG